MTGNTHFALAIHVLTALALWEQGPIPSAFLADSVGTHPAFLRELLGTLRAAGLIETQMGKGGGSMLARPAEQITLLDIYRAVDAQPSVLMHHSVPSAECPVGRNILNVLTDVMESLNAAVEETLSARTLGQIAAQIPRC